MPPRCSRPFPRAAELDAAALDEPAPAVSRTRVIVAASIGNALEFYDFTVYGYFAPQIAAAFFPGDAQASQLAAWGTYGTAFLARPLGALVLGSYADRQGRRAAMTLSILLMTAGTFMMAFMPGMAMIGWGAPLGILAARLLQGFSAGGEFGGATAFMLEHGGRRGGLMASFQFISQLAATLLAAGTAYLTALAMPAAALHAWGFRLPFILGLLICPVGFYLRRVAHDPEIFMRAERLSAPGLSVLRAHWGRILLGAGAIAGGTAGNYLMVYLPAYAQQVLHMRATDSLAVPALSAVVGLVVTPLSAHWSDRVGRLRPAFVFAPLLMAAAYPAFWAISAAPSFAVLALMGLLLVSLRSAYTAPLPALLGELFPANLRGVGMSVSYSLGVLVFGSLAPFINTWVIGVSGNRRFPGIYLGVCSLITVGCLIAIKTWVDRAGPPRPPIDILGGMAHPPQFLRTVTRRLLRRASIPSSSPPRRRMDT